MIKVIYDYKTNEGFLMTRFEEYKELRLAMEFARSLASRKDVVGKPVLDVLESA
jgi:hypothetical protein